MIRKRFIGLRNIVTTKIEWSYLVLYEIDGHDENKALNVVSTIDKMETSFIAYKTKNGFHFVGLTPINAQLWGNYFQMLQNAHKEYYSGQTLRMSLKENEKQELIHASFRYPTILNLWMLYTKRFPELGNYSVRDLTANYNCVFEKYWSVKI